VPTWLPLVLVALLGVIAVFCIGSILVVGMVQKQTRLMIEAIKNQPLPPIQKETIVKVIQTPAPEMARAEEKAMTVDALVETVRAEASASGYPLTEEELEIQREGWADYGVEEIG